MTSKFGKKPQESNRVLYMKYRGLKNRDDLSEFEMKMMAAFERSLNERGVDLKTGRKK
jgi:hypothetical protein